MSEPRNPRTSDEEDEWRLEGPGPAPGDGPSPRMDPQQALALQRAGSCLRCGKPIRSVGTVKFRTGGTTGKWKLLLDEWAELGEGLLELELRRCTSCGFVEFRTP